MNKVDKCKIENMNFGNFLKELKLEKDLTLKDIAGRSEISYQTILKMTSTEKRKPTLEQFLKIMVSTNSSLDEYLEDMLDKPKTSRKRLSIVKKFASDELSVLYKLSNLDEKTRSNIIKCLSIMIDIAEQDI